MKKCHVVWCPDGIKLIPITEQWRIDSATSLVKSALAGEYGWCFADVIKIPLADGRSVREKMRELKLERMSPNTTRARCQFITIGLATLRKLEKEYYQFDVESKKILRKNYDKLKAACRLLCGEGLMEAYTISPHGILRVVWFKEYNRKDIQLIKNSWTFDHKHNPDYYGDTGEAQQFFPTIPADQFNNTGFINKPYVGYINKGSGELDPWKLKERDAEHQYARDRQRADFLGQGYQRYYGKWVKSASKVRKDKP